ncbi:hypothetical protein J5Y03_14985 [Bacillus sp. RG28]|uniref:DUF4129 domain-containing protein n=1 Tax=Gottfriedia endophytica TaxID=2820819 RepID=A0A940NQK9_9BACI|nr:hypothetical protein [Gottfriedia endophytica]MBP0726464.1 hypothetical protein [Gottfriedia endophytica]
MIRRILPAYFFSLEGFYVYFILFLFYINKGFLPPIIPYIVVLVIGNLFLGLALRQQQVSNVLLLLGGIIGGMIGYFLGLSQISALISSLFIFFRIPAFLKNSFSWKSERADLVILFYSSSIFVFFYGWVNQYPHMKWLYSMLICFTVLYSVGRFLQQIEESHTIRNFDGISGLFGIVFLISGVITLLLPLTKLLFLKLFEGLIFLVYPLINYLINLLYRGMHNLPKNNRSNFMMNTGKKLAIGHDGTITDHSQIWIRILILVIILVTAWILIKKKSKTKTDMIKSSEFVIEHVPSFLKKNKKSRFFRGPAPHEYVRKLIYQLQIYADKNEMGRYEHETVKEWFKRVELPINEEFLLAYENVRYGQGVLARSEASHFESIIADLKRKIKERSKLMKESEEK